jgi:DNA-binding MarR family transcriptional regulator
LGDASDSRELLPALSALPGHLFWRAAARVTGALDDTLPPGVDIHAYAALLALSGGGVRSQQAIAEAISTSRTTMARIAADLAERGLVERVRNPDDKRSWSLTRTPEGAAAARRWRRHAEDVEEAVTPGFSLEERERFRGLLLALAEPDLSPETPDALRESIGFLVSRVHARMHNEFRELLEPLGIEPSHFGTVTALRALGPVSQAEIARTMGVSGAHTVQIVDDLEARGLVERRRPPTDRRTQVLHVLPAADSVLEQASTMATTKTDTMLEPLSPAEVEVLLGFLARVITAG